jgi:NADH-quinone oxidoreductase subunit A
LQGLPSDSTLASQGLWPLGAYALLVLAMLVAVIVISALVGPRHSARRRDLPYESGVPPTGSAALRFPVHFYVIALAFLIFDLEAAFLFAWAVAAREVGWLGYIELVVFIVMLLAGLVYLWAKGALDWGASPANAAASALASTSTSATGEIDR